MSLMEQTRGNWPMTADSISGMTPTYTNSAQTDSYVAAFQLVKHRKVGSTGPLCMRMQKSSCDGVQGAIAKEI
ncbi:hypothetical protein U9M48_031814 [Paspalum notatum var. saurae]|uniref:Uncharacterized protein n=1 Tax=Paspalum notatum var. saurae TaxID=547442 RepID=A0AAQ3U836_PASNO